MRNSLLLSISVLFTAGAPLLALPCGRDTITVDGVPLELELDIMEVAPYVDGKGRKGGVRRTSPAPSFNLDLMAGVTGYPRNSSGERLSAYMGRGARPLMGFSPSVDWRGARSFLRLACALDAHQDWSFDASALDDSLYALAPDGDGGLEQWLLYDYELGIELDTLEVPTSRYVQRSAMVAVSLGGYNGRPGSRRGTPSLEWWAGFHLRIGQNGREANEINRVTSGLPSPASALGGARNDWEPITVTGVGMQCGLAKALRKPEWSWVVKASWTAGLVSRWSVAFGVQRQWGR